MVVQCHCVEDNGTSFRSPPSNEIIKSIACEHGVWSCRSRILNNPREEKDNLLLIWEGLAIYEGALSDLRGSRASNSVPGWEEGWIRTVSEVTSGFTVSMDAVSVANKDVLCDLLNFD